MHKIRNLFMIFILILLSSCTFYSYEGLDYPTITGTIIDDDDDDKPVSGVELYITDDNNTRFDQKSYYSDWNGDYTIDASITIHKGISLAFDGHFIRIHTIKEGYEDYDDGIVFMSSQDYEQVFERNIDLTSEWEYR